LLPFVPIIRWHLLILEKLSGGIPQKIPSITHSKKVNNAGMSGIGGVCGLGFIVQCEQDHIR